MRPERRHVILYTCLLTILACFLFFIGFFPYKRHISKISSKSDLPSSVNGISFNHEQLYKRRYSRVVFMIIDALRYDFVSDGNRMPYLNKELQKKSSSCLLPAKTGAPTVTMPRIKAMTSGTPSSFLDVIFNFGSSKMLDDNLIHQAVTDRFRIVFYGDDTWLRLFPESFTRFEGTPSFFVNDFYEVDDIVNRNLDKELNYADWDIMILHYLGLDHIGHVEGPFGKSISPKLLEMDNVIKKIARRFENEDVLFVITGDHGMKDSGGHGGSTPEEVTVPVVLLNARCNDSFRDHAFHQVDLAPLLSTLLGIPTPAGSTGKVSPRWFASLNTDESLYAALYNTLRMKNLLLTTRDDEVEDETSKGINHLVLAFDSRLSDDSRAAAAERAFSHLYNAQDRIASTFAQSNGVNMWLIVPAIFLLIQAMGLLLMDEDTRISSFAKKHPKPTVTLLLSSVLLSAFAARYANVPYEAVLPYLLGASLLVYNTLLLSTSEFTFSIMRGADRVFLVLFGLLPLTYFSTSLVEEEHLFWYLSFATLVLRVGLNNREHWKGFLAVAVMQRILKGLNSTGVQWSSEYDIGDWLKEPAHVSLWLTVYGVGLFLSMMINWLIGWSPSPFDLLFVFLQTLTTLRYRLSVNGIFSEQSSGVSSVRFFWILTAVRIVAVNLLDALMHRRNRGRQPSTLTFKVLSVVAQLHLSFVTMFVDAHNTVLAPALVIFVLKLRSVVGSTWQMVVLHYWIGEVFFFYLGNSNSIATVNVAVGFVGLKEFHLPLAVIYVAVYTYAYQILSYLLLARELLKRKRYKNASSSHFHNLMTSLYLLLNGIPLIAFMIIITLQREHLFIWSVFSPKLLYLMVHSVLIIILTVPAALL